MQRGCCSVVAGVHSIERKWRMKKVLVTAGPVHAYLDPVKILTNRFKGRMMMELAEHLATDNDVTVVCSLDTIDRYAKETAHRPGPFLEVVHHDGFMDYMAKVNGMAKDFDAVILGAAVANLIPAAPWQIKFPSHNYKVGEIINIPFMIAPRVIDQVKKNMKPGAHLFGFKLLKGQPFDELIQSSYGVLRESGATVVFANDPTLGLDKKFAVTKERAVIPLMLNDVPEFIMNIMNDEYYRSEFVPGTDSYSDSWAAAERALDYYRDKFVEVEDGMVFGTVAFRFSRKDGGFGFVTTARGKRETDEMAVVADVNHGRKVVSITALTGTTRKATLNAPLMARIFERNPSVKGILHFHKQEMGLVTQPWAPPGTVRDTERDVETSFNVDGHGCYLLLGEKGEVMR